MGGGDESQFARCHIFLANQFSHLFKKKLILKHECIDKNRDFKIMMSLLNKKIFRDKKK